MAVPSLRKALAEMLRTTAGSLVGNRIMPGARAQSNGVPALTYLILSEIPQQDLDGFTGVSQARVEVSSWSHDLKQADQILEQIRRVWMEESAWQTVAGIQIDWILADDQVRTYEVRADGTDQGMFQVVMEFLIGHQPAAAAPRIIIA